MKSLFVFIFNNVLLGVGLAMDAFSASIVNGLNEEHMSKLKMIKIAGTFAFFQFLMPMLGWYFTSSIINYFSFLKKCIPWISLILLIYIGTKMIFYSDNENAKVENTLLDNNELIMQGIATSLDALSIGLTLANYNILMANFASLIIAVITFIICLYGVRIGRKAASKISFRAEIIGGIVLILIGIEIFLTSL